MIKAAFFDIDGTLVSFKTHEVPASTVRALDQLRSQGILTFIATGRHILTVNNLGNLKFDGYMTLNGSYCFIDLKVIYKHSIPSADISMLVNYLQEKANFPCIFVHENALYMNYINEQTTKAFQLLNFPQPPILPLTEAAQGEIFQLIAFFTPSQEMEIMPQLPHCQSTRWTSLFSDIIPLGSNKQIGMQNNRTLWILPGRSYRFWRRRQRYSYATICRNQRGDGECQRPGKTISGLRNGFCR